MLLGEILSTGVAVFCIEKASQGLILLNEGEMKVLISSRELEVLRKSAEGLTVKQIAIELNLSDEQISKLQKDILMKTRATSHFNALHVLARNGFSLRDDNSVLGFY